MKKGLERWEYDILKLGSDFCIEKSVVLGVITQTKKMRAIPDFYDKQTDFLYDFALRKLKSYVYDRI